MSNVVGSAQVVVEPTFPGFQTAVGKAAAKLLGPIEDAGHKAGEKAGDAGGEAAGKGFGAKLLSGVEKTKGGIEKIATGIGMGAAVAFGASMAGAMDNQKANARFTAQLGLTKKESARLGALAGKLYSQNYGDSVSDVNEAMKFVGQNMVDLNKTSDKNVGDITKKALDLAGTFDVDVSESTKAAGNLMKTGLAKNATQAFDIITKGLQGPSNKADDLMDTFNEYSVQFAKMGMDGPTALGLINQAVKAGARDSDIAADAIKEFSLRTVGTLETTDSKGRKQLTSLGQAFQNVLPPQMDMYDAQQKLAKGGPGAKKTFQQMMDGLKGLKDPATQAYTATQLFGTQAEDMGKSLYAFNTRTATKELGNLSGAASKMDKQLNDNASANIETFKRQISQTFVDVVGKQVLPKVTAFTGAMAANPTATKVVIGVVGGLAAGLLVLNGAMKAITFATEAWSTAQKIASVVSKGFSGAMKVLNASFLTNPVFLIVAGIVALAAGLIYAYKHSEKFRKIVDATFHGIKTVAVAVFNWFKGPFISFWTDTLPGAGKSVMHWFATVWHGIVGVVTWPFKTAAKLVTGAWHGITGAFTKSKNWVSGTWKKGWNGAKNWIGDSVSKGKDAIHTAWDRTTSKFASAKKWTSTTFKNGWSAVSSWISAPVRAGRDKTADFLSQHTGIASKLQGLKDFGKGTFKRSWAGMKMVISDPVQAGKNAIANAKAGAQRVLNGMDNFGRKVFGKKWDGMKATLAKPVNWFNDKIYQLFGPGGKIRTKLSGFADAAKGIFGRFASAIEKPINWLIDKVNHGLIKGGINKLLGALGVPKSKQVPWIPPVKFAEGGRSKGRSAWERSGTDRIPALVDDGEFHVKTHSTSRLDRQLPGGLDYMNRTGKWPVGPTAETGGANEQARRGPSAPITAGVPADLRAVIARGPRPGDPAGFGGPRAAAVAGGSGGVDPTSFARAQNGMMGWYNRCLAFVNAAWQYSVPRFRLATARQSMNAGPRNMAGMPPAGSAVYWDTGPAGHVALADGAGDVWSNDIRQAGRIDLVRQQELNKWGPYRGWWNPTGAGTTNAGFDPGGSGGGGIFKNVLGFLGKLSPLGWLKDKASGLLRGMPGGRLGQALLSVPGWLLNKGKDGLSKLLGGSGQWAGGAVGGWDNGQLNNAQTIVNTARSLGLGPRGAQIGLMTAMQESTLRNLNYGDRDSLGLFQQRDAWGPASARTNPAQAARMFFTGGRGGQRGLMDFAWRAMGLGQAAQAVQVSAFPGAYDRWAGKAQEIVARSYDTGGRLPQGLSLVHNGTGREELILNPQQEAAARSRGGDGDFNVNIEIKSLTGRINDADIRQLVQALEDYDRRRNGIRRERKTVG